MQQIINIFIWAQIFNIILNIILTIYLNKKYFQQDHIEKNDYTNKFISMWLFIITIVTILILIKIFSFNILLASIYLICFNMCIYLLFRNSKKGSPSLTRQISNLLLVTGLSFIEYISLLKNFRINSIMNYNKYLIIILFLIFLIITIFLYLFTTAINVVLLFSEIREILKMHINFKNCIISDNQYVKSRIKCMNIMSNTNSKIKQFFYIPIYIIHFLFYSLFNKIVKTIKKATKNIIIKINLLIDNWKIILKKTIYISIIISVVISYIYVINSSIFSQNVKDTYNFIATIVVIPLMLHFFNNTKK